MAEGVSASDEAVPRAPLQDEAVTEVSAVRKVVAETASAAGEPGAKDASGEDMAVSTTSCACLPRRPAAFFTHGSHHVTCRFQRRGSGEEASVVAFLACPWHQLIGQRHVI